MKKVVGIGISGGVDSAVAAYLLKKDGYEVIGITMLLIDNEKSLKKTDFVKTGSYSPKLNEFSVYYKTFYGVLNIRTISAEYLIAMKLRSGRKYKNDLSDVIGILAEHEKKGEPITFEKIETAVTNLYGAWDDFPEDSKPFIEDALKNGDFENIYKSVKKDEVESKDILIDFSGAIVGCLFLELMMITKIKIKSLFFH